MAYVLATQVMRGRVTKCTTYANPFHGGEPLNVLIFLGRRSQIRETGLNLCWRFSTASQHVLINQQIAVTRSCHQTHELLFSQQSLRSPRTPNGWRLHQDAIAALPVDLAQLLH